MAKKHDVIAEKMLAKRTDVELIREWEIVSEADGREAEIMRGWILKEIEKRWPEEYGSWMENCIEDDNIRSYIKIAA